MDKLKVYSLQPQSSDYLIGIDKINPEEFVSFRNKLSEKMKYFRISKSKKSPLILNIPHSSCRIPKKFQSDFLLSKNDLKKEAIKSADLYTNELFKSLYKHYGGIIMEISRVVVDAERFLDDAKEEMSKLGRGALYSNSESKKKLRKINCSTSEEIIKTIYMPYHKTLTFLVGESLNKYNKCLILDCHSFPSTPRWYEKNKIKIRPDICLGTDSYHTPKKLVKILKSEFEKNNFSVKINSPYKGAIVPLKYYEKDKRVNSILIEVNRRIYMDEELNRKIKNFASISSKINNVILNSLKKSNFL